MFCSYCYCEHTKITCTHSQNERRRIGTVIPIENNWQSNCFCGLCIMQRVVSILLQIELQSENGEKIVASPRLSNVTSQVNSPSRAEFCTERETKNGVRSARIHLCFCFSFHFIARQSVHRTTYTTQHDTHITYTSCIYIIFFNSWTCVHTIIIAREAHTPFMYIDVVGVT